MGKSETGYVDTGGRRAEDELLAGLDSITNFKLRITNDAAGNTVGGVDTVDGKGGALVLDADDAALLDGFMQTRWDKANSAEGGFEVLPVSDKDVFAVFERYPMYECAVLNAMYSYFRNDLSFACGTAFMMALNLGKAVFTIKRVVA